MQERLHEPTGRTSYLLLTFNFLSFFKLKYTYITFSLPFLPSSPSNAPPCSLPHFLYFSLTLSLKSIVSIYLIIVYLLS